MVTIFVASPFNPTASASVTAVISDASDLCALTDIERREAAARRLPADEELLRTEEKPTDWYREDSWT
jgi:hypothetical protein